ncbi:hypothetical protein [Flexivirga sp. B27]
MTQTPDRIENVVEINAPLARVWTLVSSPGWWLGDGPDGIQDPPEATKKRYPVQAVENQPQDYCSFRWAPTTPDIPLTEANSTLIEFFLAESEGVVTVRVLETGFAALAVDDETRAAGFRDNTSGWENQLGALREASEAA